MPELLIDDCGLERLPSIRRIAYQTWPAAYGEILTAKQIQYMLDRMYALPALTSNLLENHHAFAIASIDGKEVGFVSFEHGFRGDGITRIHKLYMLPEAQGKGTGAALLEYVEHLARSQGSERLSLNVNRYNKAQHFYLKHGFEIVGREDIGIGNNYLMEDFIMEKQL